MSETTKPTPTTPDEDRSLQNGLQLPGWLLIILPLLLLGLLVWLLITADPLGALIGAAPPIETLTFEHFALDQNGITASLVNGGPESVVIAQVQVDDAYWQFTVEPSQIVPRLGRAIVQIPYPWVSGETHVVRLITSTGVTFEGEIAVALETPQPDASFWLLFALLGFYVGIVPVGLGLLWFPILRRLDRRGMNFILALTVGLLVFLLVDTLLEATEIAGQIPDVFQAVPLIAFVGLLSFLVLVAVSRQRSAADRSTRQGRLWLATSIALGIGLHNLGEGMAIGAAVALGEAALGTFLVIGFTLHNITEGIGIGAPMAHDRPGWRRLVGLALLAGGPAIVGTWLGGFAYSPLLAVVFLALGAGAILQVVYEVGRLLVADRPQSLASWVNLAGLVVGLGIMYATALLVKF